MAKFARPANRSRLYVWGKAYDFYLVTSNGAQGNLVEGTMLNEPKLENGVATGQAEDYWGTPGNPLRSSKHQVVLHCTAANHSAEGVVGWWNAPASPPASSQLMVERSSTAPAARPAPTAGADASDAGLVDAVLILPEDSVAYHAGLVNAQSIGIEISNVAWGWYLTNAANEPTLTPRCNPQSNCPQRVNVAAPNQAPAWRCNCIRPRDENRWIHLQDALGGYRDYQAFEDEQYTALVLLLRHLTMSHGIARRFLGDTTQEVYRRFANEGTVAERRLGENRVLHFRGIFHHRNVHADKACPGVLHRNRLFRGLIDEWWMPVQTDGTHRPYYSGPFATPPYVNGQATRPAYLRWTGFQGGNPVVEARTWRHANLDAITGTKSYFDLDRVAHYYAACETRHGGIFPIGNNRIWHGGIHLFPAETNPAVYAAASGTIVAARVSSNAETDAAPTFGSQRFVLLRHYVHLDTALDPRGRGTGIDWSAEPKRIFSLYMHLAPIARVDREDDSNPPWFNLWRRRHADADVGLTAAGKGVVFNPDLEVSVGDLLGAAGTYNGRRCLHFEVFSHRNGELTLAPWNVDNLRADDSDDQDAACDVAALMQYFTDVSGDGLDVVDLLRAAPLVRAAKTRHKSEWSLASADALAPVVTDETYRNELWTHIQRLTFWDEALAANAALRDQMGADGIVWHYHPVTFMRAVNDLVLAENRQIHEDPYPETNVELDREWYLSQFIARRDNAWVQVASDAQPLRPYRIAQSSGIYDHRYHFTRDDAACRGCRDEGTHPQSTRVHLSLVDIVEQARAYLNFPIGMAASHLCARHAGEAARCALNEAAAARLHGAGVAIDIRPDPLVGTTAAVLTAYRQRCTDLWRTLNRLVTTWFNPLALERGGTPSQDSLPTGYNGMRLRVVPAQAQAYLEAGQPLGGDVAPSDVTIHLELTPEETAADAVDTTPAPVRLAVTVESLKVLDDLDVFSAGEWELNLTVNGVPTSTLKRPLTSGDTVPLGTLGFRTEVSVDAARGERLTVETTSVERDRVFDDDPGRVRVEYDASSTPAWGIGRRTIRSSTGAYELTLHVESLNPRVSTL